MVQLIDAGNVASRGRLRRPPPKFLRSVAPPVDLESIDSGGIAPSRPLPFPFSIQLTPPVRQACIVASVALSAIGCLIGIASGWSLLFGLTALACGLLGMQDNRKRDLATMGLVLSVIAIFLGSAQIGFDAWTKYDAKRWVDELQGVQAP